MADDFEIELQATTPTSTSNLNANAKEKGKGVRVRGGTDHAPSSSTSVSTTFRGVNVGINNVNITFNILHENENPPTTLSVDPPHIILDTFLIVVFVFVALLATGTSPLTSSISRCCRQR